MVDGPDFCVMLFLLFFFSRETDRLFAEAPYCGSHFGGTKTEGHWIIKGTHAESSKKRKLMVMKCLLEIFSIVCGLVFSAVFWSL